ncbi:NAD(P)H-dependent flavin oxidoreductase [Staphylococcus delphini]|uniref:NAD(P)H-dependent flavin oxidoreductase n=1 Tax=Staphylococcus delphini TaxID=53344 RepID=UPI000BBBF305|nr:nitronate monooxygenase [Staphylococcus delphini]PCF46480.1 nitronate monooxygenase [Staphylococcus delphini]PCF71659.1 nitronate monooxygenase [Staphylococcus delphini]
MWYKTKVTEQCRIDYPIIQAGMAGSTTPELVATVSELGGLGTIGAGYMTPAALEQEILKVKARTSKPFSVNLFVPESFSYTDAEVSAMNSFLAPYRQALNLEQPTIGEHDPAAFDRMIDIVIQQQVPICSFTFGIPDEKTINRLKAAGTILIGSATTVEEAKAVEAAGLDAVVAQGSEAGGHRATFSERQETTPLIGTMALIPQVVDHVNIPVIAAGGVMDSRGWLASHALGAQGVQMGTAFLTTHESNAKSVHKQAIFNSNETDAIVTHEISGKPARGLHNALIQHLREEGPAVLPYPIQNDLTKQIRAAAGKAGLTKWMHMWSGQGVRLAQDHDAATFFKQLIQNAQSQAEQFNM